MFTHLAKRFPQWQAKIEQMFHDDPDFQALCREYEETARTLAFWDQLSRLPMKQIARQKLDCKEFLQELETDILMILENQFPQPASGAAQTESNSKRR